MNAWIQSLGIPVLKPLLATLVLPPMPWLLMVLLGAWLLRRRATVGWLLLLAGVALEYASFTTAAADATAQWLLSPPPAMRDPAHAVDPPPADGRTVIVVLGGGRTASAEYPEVSLNPISMERLRYGAWLARQTGLPLAFSGGVGPASGGGPSEGSIARRIASQEFGVPLRWVEDRSRDTRENALLTVRMLRGEQVGRIVLVTHDLHMPRAVRHFERARDAAELGFEIVPAPVGITEPYEPWAIGDYLPSPQGIARFRYAVREWLGLLAGA